MFCSGLRSLRIQIKFSFSFFPFCLYPILLESERKRKDQSYIYRQSPPQFLSSFSFEIKELGNGLGVLSSDYSSLFTTYFRFSFTFPPIMLDLSLNSRGVLIKLLLLVIGFCLLLVPCSSPCSSGSPSLSPYLLDLSLNGRGVKLLLLVIGFCLQFPVLFVNIVFLLDLCFCHVISSPDLCSLSILTCSFDLPHFF